MAIKIEIFDKPKPDKTPTLMLNTRVTLSGTFEVFACDASGDERSQGGLWSLQASGRQECWPGINKRLGLDLDENGQIREV